jgi:hypothetical protein
LPSPSSVPGSCSPTPASRRPTLTLAVSGPRVSAPRAPSASATTRKVLRLTAMVAHDAELCSMKVLQMRDGLPHRCSS